MSERRRPRFKIKTGTVGFKDSEVVVEDMHGNEVDISAGCNGVDVKIRYGEVTQIVLQLHPDNVEVDAEGLFRLETVEVHDGK